MSDRCQLTAMSANFGGLIGLTDHFYHPS